uniref:Ground-like domain-containing protein n=1 Tax=Ditylenchus dipsaci TaxID=166011 RepID=A0A915D7W6_9BILA
MGSIRLLITVSLSIIIARGHIGPGGGYQTSGGCSGGAYTHRQPPPCGGHMPTPLPYAPVPPPPPPYPTPPYQALQYRRIAEAAHGEILTTHDSTTPNFAYRDEKEDRDQNKQSLRRDSTAKIPLPATLASEDSDKEQPFVRPLTYENLSPRYENQPPRYPNHPSIPILPEPVPPYQAGPTYQEVSPPVPPYQAIPLPVPLPSIMNATLLPTSLSNAPPPQPTPLRPMQPPPLNNCCARCDRGCKHAHAHRRAFVTKTKNATNNTLKFFDNLDFNNPSECTSKQLKNIIKNNAAVNMTIAKEVIQRTAEKELGDGVFHVICSSADLEYTTRTFSFCFGEVADGICYVFRTN